MDIIYFDNSATTQVLPQVAAAMTEAMVAEYGNPSSLHGLGVAGERLLHKSREIIAKVLKVEPGEIYFTSGGTEANNWAIISTARQRQGRGKHLITTQIEHPSVLGAFNYLAEEGFQVSYLPVNEEGLVSPTALEDALTEETILVSIIGVNNETGMIQPIEEMGLMIKKLASHALFHVDWVQGFGKIPLEPEKAQIDLLTISAHKIHGPKGSGALYLKKNLVIPPLLVGGEQERKLRAGTENVPGIVGFGVAVEAGARSYSDKLMEEMGDYLMEGLKTIPGCHFNGNRTLVNHRAPYIINTWFEGVDRGEVLIHMLEEQGLYVSSGSACHSRRQEPSHVLQAMGKEKEALYGAIRLSLSHLNTLDEIQRAIDIIKHGVVEYRDFRGGL